MYSQSVIFAKLTAVNDWSPWDIKWAINNNHIIIIIVIIINTTLKVYPNETHRTMYSYLQNVFFSPFIRKKR